VDIDIYITVDTRKYFDTIYTRMPYRERMIIGPISYRNWYWVYRIESYRLLLYRPILRASLQVHQLLTGRITHGDQRAFKRLLRHSPTARASVLFYGPWYGRGLERGKGRKETVTWYQPARDTKTAQYWS